jgi:hypothetical protein
MIRIRIRIGIECKGGKRERRVDAVKEALYRVYSLLRNLASSSEYHFMSHHITSQLTSARASWASQTPS